MTAARIVREGEPLAHGARVRRMVALGREVAARPEVAAGLTELERGDAYARCLALYACFGSRDSGPVMRALADPSRMVRSLAFTNVMSPLPSARSTRSMLLISPSP